MTLTLIASVAACCWYAWRPRAARARRGRHRERTIAACGWASVALLVTLSWVLPWYVLWVLPLAALSASRWLRAAALVLGVYLIIAWAPGLGAAVGRDRLPSRKDLARAAAPALRARAPELKARRGHASGVPRRTGARLGRGHPSSGGRRSCLRCALRRFSARRRSREAAVGPVARRLRGTSSAARDALGQPRERELAVASLRAGVLRDGHDPRAGALEQALALGRAERGGCARRRRSLPRARR